MSQSGRALTLLMAALTIAPPAWGQTRAAGPLADRYVDAVNGLSLDQAIAGALEREPGLRATRAEVDVARGMRVQAGLRPNPSLSFERRDEPAGTDSQTTVAIEWPLDVFRRNPRIAVADREISATRFAVADRERLLASEVRTRYGEVLIALRELRVLDELVTTATAQLDAVRARVDEGAAPPLERDLLDVDRRRLEAERLLQAGTVDLAMIELRRVLGRQPNAPLRVRETLDAVVLRESTATPSSAGAADLVEERPDVREASSRLDLADAKIGWARSNGTFDVSVFANYMRMDAGFPQRGVASDGGLAPIRGLFHYVSAGATVTIPLLNRNQGDVAAARAERTGASARYDAVVLSARAELAAARVRDERARQALQVYREAAQDLARRNLAVIRQSHELGRVTIFDVLAEQRRYLDVERAYTATLREAYDARTALERATGGVR